MTSTEPSYLEAIEALAHPAKHSGLPWPILASKAPPFREPKWLVRDFWPMGLLGLLVGDGGTFKSSLALHIAGAVAGGYQVFDRYQAERYPVLVLSAEDKEDVMRMRLEAFVVGHGWDERRVMDNIHLYSRPEPVLGSVAWRRHLHEVIRDLKIGFVILDPWADLIDGDENANSEVRPAIKYLRELMEHGSTSVAVVHHMGKGGPDKRTIDRIRGATGLPHASRIIYAFEWHENAVHVENVKMSRMERLPTFVLDRTIRSATENRMHWEAARVTTKDAAQHRDSESRRWVLLAVAAHPGVGTNALKDVAKRSRAPGRYTPSNQDMQVALKSLVAEGYLFQERGSQGRLSLKLTDSGRHLASTFTPVGPGSGMATSDVQDEPAPSLFDHASGDSGMVRHGSEGEDGNHAYHASTMPRHGSEMGLGALGTPHPLKGVRGGTSGEPPSTRDDDDLRALDDERAGMEEGL